MSRIPRSLLVGIALAASVGAGAVAAQDQDPEFGTLLAQREALRGATAECAARYPDTKDKLDAQMAEWTGSHADKLEVVEEILKAMPAEQRAALDQALKPMAEMVRINLDAAEKDGQGRQACGEVFASLGGELKSGRYDADNAGEAVGMYGMMVLVEERLGPGCLERVPEMKDELIAAQSRWHEQDAAIQGYVKAQVEGMAKDRPDEMERMRKTAGEQVASAFELLAKVGPDATANYCRKEYAEMVDGTKRQQTPNMYKFLDEAVAGKQQ